MTRTQNPFTDRQIRLLQAIQAKLREIDNPNKSCVTHESYWFDDETTKNYGKIPKIRFRPNSQSIKAGIMRSAGLIESVSAIRKEKLARIKDKIGYEARFRPKTDRDRLADLFDKEWNNLMFKAKKAVFTLALLNQSFANGDEPVAEPVVLLQGIVMEKFCEKLSKN